jgi:hypothetical protein
MPRTYNLWRRCAPAAIGLAVALCAPLALAADPPPAKTTKPATTSPKPAAKATEAKPREGALGKGTSTLPMLTRDELRQCLAEQDRIKKEGADLADAQTRLDGERSAIERLGSELEAEKAKVDVSDEAAVNAYNARVRLRTKQAEEYRAAVPVFNARVDKLAADGKAYATACADRRFFEDDYDAIKAGK